MGNKLVNKNYKDENLVNELSKELLKIINKSSDIVIVNIGTDKCIGDCLAPMVGTMLKENNFTFPVYGTIKEPIHAKNLEKRFNEIKVKHPNSLIIGIDACLGDEETVKYIALRDYPISPGKGVGKTLPQVGDYSLIGIIGDSNNDFIFSSSGIRLDFIMDMAKVISKSLVKAEKEYYILNKEIAICNL